MGRLHSAPADCPLTLEHWMNSLTNTNETLVFSDFKFLVLYHFQYMSRVSYLLTFSLWVGGGLGQLKFLSIVKRNDIKCKLNRYVCNFRCVNL